MSHTPGPWSVRYGGSSSDDGFGIVTNSAIAERVKLVAECWPVAIVDHRHREELSANARLIAAAPDLLEALESALYYYEAFRDGSPIGPTERDDMASIHAVIAKAKGETS